MRTLGRVAIVAGLLLVFSGCERVEKAVREDLPLARTTKARTDAQTIATAVNTYRVTCGALPESIEALVTQTTVGGAPCGPVLGSIPAPPAFSTAARVSRSPSRARSTSPRRAPSIANRTAVARPMPPAAPVISTTLPSNRRAAGSVIRSPRSP